MTQIIVQIKIISLVLFAWWYLNRMNKPSAQTYYRDYLCLLCYHPGVCVEGRLRNFITHASLKSHFAKTHTIELAGLLDHDGPIAEGLSCDCTYQSDSWCESPGKEKGLGISWRLTFSSKWLIRRVILSCLRNCRGIFFLNQFLWVVI